MSRQYAQGDTFYPVFSEPSEVSSVDALIMRLSDGFFYDFNDSTFKDSGWTTKELALTEKTEGIWVNTTGWTTPSSDDTYLVIYKDNSGYVYEGPELQVGNTTLDAVLADTTGLNGDAMRGTDSAATAAGLSTHDGKLDTVDTNVDSVLVDTGTTIPGLIAALNDLSAAQINAEMVDVMTVDTIAELSQGAPTTTPTFATALMLLYMALRNSVDVDASLKEFYNNAGVVIWKKSLSDDGTNYTEAKGATGP